jgi:hypothetical protein
VETQTCRQFWYHGSDPSCERLKVDRMWLEWHYSPCHVSHYLCRILPVRVPGCMFSYYVCIYI